MRIQTLAAAAVLSLAATIPLSTAAFADEPCLTAADLKVQLNGSHCPPHLPIGLPKPGDEDKRRVNLCDGPMHGIIEDEKLHKVRENVREHLKDGKLCRDDESEHKRRSHDDPEEKSSHHKKSDDSDSDDNDSSDSDSSDSKADDDSDDDDDTTSTQVKVVPKGSVDTGDGSSL